jgi:hypothetical protein
MKFQGMARRKKGPRKWLECGRLRRLILLLGEGRFSRNFRVRTANAAGANSSLRPRRAVLQVLIVVLPARPRAVRRYMPHLRQFKAAAKRKQR